MKENPYSHLDDSAGRFAYLVAGFIRNSLTENEHDELDDWINTDDKYMKLFEDLTDEKNVEANLAWLDKVQSEKSYNELQKADAFKLPAKRFRLNRTWIAAASVILLVGAFFIFRNTGNKNENNNIMAASDTTQLRPGGNRAVLTFADGSQIDLSTAKKGLMKNDNGADIIKLSDGIILYDAHNSEKNLSSVHTLSTPLAGQYHLTLPDGTKVWLNAATSLRYPSQFASGERRVELNGEAYFEVAKNEKQPFRVILADSADITVLGTHFNVKSYSNEKAKEVTLLEGSVRISPAGGGDLSGADNNKRPGVELKPGQQAVLIHHSPFTIHNNVDTEEVIGWKDGWFVFHDATIESVMNQVERWYDAKIVYEGEIKDLFNATILRKEPLTKLLRILETNDHVHFKIKDKTIYVLP